MTEAEEAEIREKLSELQVAHQDLDASIHALSDNPATNSLQLQRLKRQKLALKDEIARLEDLLIPDIIA